MSQSEQSRPNWEASELSSEQDLLETDWFMIANQLRQQNQELVKATVYLEETLAQKEYVESNDLLQEQREKIIILTEQLTASQNRITQLEEIHQSKNQELVIMQKQLKELENRLYRQQRSTLQYKAALNNNLNPHLTSNSKPYKSIDLPSFLIGEA